MALAPRIRKTLRVLALLLAILVALVTLPLIAMQLPVVRGHVLERLVQQARKSLPGELHVRHAAWPSTGRLLLEELQWVAAGDTLLAIDRFELRWEPWALARRELHLPLVQARVSRLNVPKINLAMSAASQRKSRTSSTEESKDSATNGLPWFRKGAVRGLPSMLLRDVHIELGAVRASDSLFIESLQLRLHSDLRSGRMPNVVVQQLQLKLQEPDVEISEGSLHVDLQTGRLEMLVRTSEGSPWTIAVTSNTTTADVIDLEMWIRHAADEPLALLSLHGDLLSHENRVVGVRFASQIHTPGVVWLRQLPFLRASLASVPDLEGIQVNNEGMLEWLPSWRLDLATRLEANAWLQGGKAQLHYHNDSLQVSDIELRLAEATVRGDWQKAAEAMRGQLELRVQGTAWMSDLLPDVVPPDRLMLDVKARIEQQKDAMELAASLQGRMQQGTTSVDDLRLEATAASFEDLLFRVRGRARGWQLAGNGRVVLGDSIQLLLEPLLVEQAPAGVMPAWSQPLRAPKSFARIAWQPQRGLRVDALAVHGDLGKAVIGASWKPDRGGEATLKLAWPRAPEVLLRAVADSSLRDQLKLHWSDDAEPYVEIRTRLETRQETQRLDARGSFRLPGPRILASVLPESIQVQDLDAIRATFGGRLIRDSLDTTWNATLDLDETAWLDSSGVHVRGRNDSLLVESMRLLWDGLDLRVTGAADSSAVDLVGTLQFDADRFVARLPQEVLRSIDLQAAATWHIAGSPEAPDLDADIQARVESPWGGAPQLVGEVSMRQGLLRTAKLDAPAGVVLQGLQWDRLQLDVGPEKLAGIDGSRIRLSLAAAQQELRSVLWLDASTDMTLQADSLYVRVFDRELRTEQRFIVEKSAAALQLRDLRLSGSLGTASAELLVSADTLAGLVNLDLQMPEQPDLLDVPEGAWPRSLRLRAAAAGNDSLAVFLQASGLQLGDHSGLSVLADVRATPDSTHFKLKVVDPKVTVLDSRGYLPVAWTIRPLSFALRADSLRIQAVFKEFPIPDVSGDPRAVVDFLDRSPEGAWAHLNGTLQLVGPLAEPRGHGYLTLQPQDPGLRGYKAHVFIALAQRERSWGAALQKQLERLSTSDLLTAPGAKLAVWVQQDSFRVVDAAAHLPVDIGFEEGSLKIDSGASLRAAVRASQVKLATLNSLLPPRTSLDGVVSVALQADGAWRDPQLSGGFTFKDLSVRVPDGSRVRASGKIDLQGTASDPGVKGEVNVRDGLIRIPEIPRTLLPVEGEALLLAAVETSTEPQQAVAKQPDATADSIAQNAVATPSNRPAATLPKSQRRDTQAVVEASSNNSDVFLKIPGAFWIRGRGFEVELSGNLQLTVRDGQPRIVGELKAERGALQLMASKFPVKSGRVLFFGDDETNPSLDLVMGRKYGDVSVEVVVQGTAKEPIIEFRSDPQLTEDEILSYVLFGRGTSQLDETQTQKYDERVLALASLLTANLGEGISSRSGIDMVGLEQSAETSDRASLVVGKYLSPRVLLKYVLDLERGQGYAVNVEYWLKGGLRLMTSTSRYNQSGMELNWSHEY